MSDSLQDSIPEPACAGALGRQHARRLREVYRSAGWPCQDVIEIELLAAGLLQRIASPLGHETLRVTDVGMVYLAASLQRNRQVFSAHEASVERVACEMLRAGRITWRNLSLRAQVPGNTATGPNKWCIARPDIFSIRNTSVASYLEPVVHEIKVRRSDLLGDLRKPEKRAAYLDLGGQCWYVLGNDARGKSIASADEIPAECGVMILQAERLEVVRSAPAKARKDLPFHIWMALAKATPVPGLNDEFQYLLADTGKQDINLT